MDVEKTDCMCFVLCCFYFIIYFVFGVDVVCLYFVSYFFYFVSF